MSKGARNRTARRLELGDGRELEITGTGAHEEIFQHAIADDDVLAEPGEHVWAIFATWRIDPAKYDPTVSGSGVGILDHENMLGLMGPGCFICEQLYTPEIAAARCPGDPQAQ